MLQNIYSILAVFAIVHLTAALVTAEYGWSKGFHWFPIFLAAFFLGFPPVVLAIAIGGRIVEARG